MTARGLLSEGYFRRVSRRRRTSLMQKLFVPMTKTLPVALETGRRHHRRIAVIWVPIERRFAPRGYVVACGYKAIVRTLLLDSLVVECGRLRRGINRHLV